MTYRFDDFHLNPATRELRKDGVLIALPARAFDCLAYLIEHRDRAVGRDELIGRLTWFLANRQLEIFANGFD